MVVERVDDILVSGRSDDEHARNLKAVLEKLSERGLRLKKKKCRFMHRCVEYQRRTSDPAIAFPRNVLPELIALNSDHQCVRVPNEPT